MPDNIGDARAVRALERAFRRIEHALTSALDDMQRQMPPLHPRQAQDYLERLAAMADALAVLREHVLLHVQDTGQRGD